MALRQHIRRGVLDDVKVGDALCIDMAQDDLRIVYVERVTATQVVANDQRRYNKDGTCYGHTSSQYRVKPATDDDVSAWIVAKERRAQAKEAQRAYDAREDVQLAKRISYTEWLPLGIDKLRRIQAIIEEPKNDG